VFTHGGFVFVCARSSFSQLSQIFKVVFILFMHGHKFVGVPRGSFHCNTSNKTPYLIIKQYAALLIKGKKLIFGKTI